LFLFLLPFQVWNGTVFPSQTGKILFAGWVSPILLVFILIQSSFLKTESFKITIIDFGLVVYVLFYFVHQFLIKPVNLHPFSGIEILVSIIVYLFVRNQLSINIFWILVTLCVVAFVQAFYGVLQHISILPSQHQTFKVTGTFFNPAPFAGYLAVSLPVILGGTFYFFNHKPAKYLSIFLFIMITVLGALVLAKSRAAWLAVVVSTINLFSLQGKSMNLSVYPIKFSFWNKFQNFKYQKPVVFALIVSLIVVGAWKLYSIRPESANGRLLVWKSTAQIIADYPVTGVGTGQFASKYMHYQAQYLQNKNNKEEILLAENTIFTFNEFIRLTAEHGFPGLFFVLFLLFLIFKPVQINDLNFIIAKSGLLSILIFSLLSYPGSVLPVKVLSVIFMAIIVSKQKQHLISISFINAYTRKILMLFFAAVLTVSLIGYYRNLNGTTIACRDWNTASEEIEANRFESGIEHCKSAYPFLKFDGFFMILYGNLLKKVGNYTDEEIIFEEATHLLPLSDVYLSLGDCYLEQQKFNLAENTYKYALQLVPTRIKPVYSLAKLYMQNGKENEALCVIENYLESEFKKRTIASYEIELDLIELKKEIETFIK
jgi:tetratricopeptide (TPR) repeat protein